MCPATIPDFSVTLLGGAGDDVFEVDGSVGAYSGTAANVLGQVLVSTNVAGTAGSALPAGLIEEGGTDALFVDDFAVRQGST